MLKLSILDQSTHSADIPQAQAIRDTVELAVLAEDLGYHRFWVSEHHNHPTILGTAPEILMAAISQRTERIRLGSAGVMLPHYASLKVAEQFRVLEALAPGRIDLGLGRAPGGDGRTAYALNPNAHEDAEQFPSHVRDLLAWVAGEPLVDGHPFAGVDAFPHVDTRPEPWMLGTSDYGAQVAALLGIPYCFAHFITDGQGVERALKIYRERYKPSAAYPSPKAAVGVWALAAETEEQAAYEFRTRAAWKTERDTGQLGPLKRPGDIDPDSYNSYQRQKYDLFCRTSIYGTGGQVFRRLEELAATYDVEDVVVLTWTHDQEARRQSYRLLAEASRAQEAEQNTVSDVPPAPNHMALL